MLAERGEVVDTLAPERIAELRDRGVEDATDLGRLAARCEAAARAASGRRVDQARAAVARASDGGSIEEAEAAVKNLERDSVRRWTDRTECELALVEVAERTAVELTPGSTRWESDGRLVATTQISADESLPVVVASGGATGEVALLWQTSRSTIRGDGTQEGECDSQHAAVARIAAEFGEGMALEEPAPATAAETKPPEATRRATP